MACFSAAEVEGSYFVIGRSDRDEKMPVHPEVSYLQLGSDPYAEFLGSLAELDGLIVFHGLLDTNLKVAMDILKLRYRRFKTGWIIYGAEIQNSSLTIDRFHGPLTRRAYYRLKPIRLALPFLKLLPGSDRWLTRSVIGRMDYFIHFLPEELTWVEKELGIVKPRLWFTYVMIEDFIGAVLSTQYVSNANNILIGNSSSFASNHLEVIDRMVGKLEQDCKVIVPLSYGNKQYGRYILEQGNRQLGDQFRPLTELVPRAEYNALLLSCPVVLMNHFRQQGLGNILSALWMGARVHLNEDVSTYQFLKREGVHIFTMEDFFSRTVDGKFIVEPLPKTLADENRERLNAIFGRENVARQIRQSFRSFR